MLARASPTARSRSGDLLPRGPILSGDELGDGGAAPTALVRASPAALVCDSQEDLSFSATTKPPADSRRPTSLHRPPRSVHRRSDQPGCPAASSGSKDSIG